VWAMRPEMTRSSGKNLREVEYESPHQDALREVERQRRFAKAIDRLLTSVLADDDLDDLLQKLLEIFVEIARPEIAVIRLREGDRLRSRAAVGLEEEVAAGFSVPIVDQLAGQVAAEGPLLVSTKDANAAFISDFIRKKGVRSLYCLNLVKGDFLVGVVLLGLVEGNELSDEDKHLLNVLATRAGAAVVRSATLESLRTAIRSRDEVLAVVAHDLKNPLTVIGMAANTLLRRLPDSSRRPLERIIRAAERAGRLLHDLLEIGAIEAGRFSLQKRLVDPADIILSSVESQQGLAAGASVIIATDLSPELPAVDADEERLLEVLENLVGNAIKFTSPGGSILVGAARQDTEIVFSVKDSGSGISAHELPHIFDRFWQARKTERRGTGLGLTICKGIVEAHGGRIWAESALNQGTAMSFTIPMAHASTPRDDLSDVANILLVDDRPENLLSLKSILERPEYRLATAASGEEALGLALRSHFDVALIDVAMPGMNGLEVATHLKALERSRNIPIIFITAFGNDPEEIHRAYSAGGADYLVKPLDPEIVRKKVAVFVDLSRRRLGNRLSRGRRSITDGP
jgi:signal transduction histidine kinase/ActR/RegA family two-component response regulator